MRPYSLYLNKIKSEDIRAKYNLAGSSPPVPNKWRTKYLKLTQTESSKTPEKGSVISNLEKRLKVSNWKITLCPGSSQAAFQVLAALTSPGDKILLEMPVYEPFVSAAKFLGLKIKYFKRTGDFASDIRQIRKRAVGCSLILISNPHCPTGHLYSSAELNKISRVKKLVVDEVFLPLFSNGLASLSSNPEIISIGGFSKSLGFSSFRVGWVAGPPDIVKSVEKIGFNLNIDMPTASIQLADLALKQWQGIINETLERVERNRGIINAFDKGHPGNIPFGFQRGHFFVLKVPKRFKSGIQFAMALLKKSVWVRAGEDFGMPGFVRIQATLSPKDFESAFARIESFYE